MLVAMGLVLLLIGGFAWFIYQLGGKPREQETPSFVLGAIGRPAKATLAEVGKPRILGRYGHGPSFYSVPVRLRLIASDDAIETRVTCTEPQLALLQAGASCELLLDPADSSRLMIASVKNAFGVDVKTEIGSSHFRW